MFENEETDEYHYDTCSDDTDSDSDDDEVTIRSIITTWEETDICSRKIQITQKVIHFVNKFLSFKRV